MSRCVSVITDLKAEKLTHKATDVRMFSPDSEKIFLEFKPVRFTPGKEMQWEDWNCFDSLFVYRTDYERFLTPALEEMFPIEDPDPLGWGTQECFDAMGPNFIGREDWIRFIHALEAKYGTLRNDEKMFMDKVIPILRSFLDISDCFCVDGNQ